MASLSIALSIGASFLSAIVAFAPIKDDDGTEFYYRQLIENNTQLYLNNL